MQTWRPVSGRDCGLAFAPVCRIQSIHMVLATVAEIGWTVWQLDVQTSFFYADVEEKVWVRKAPAYEISLGLVGSENVYKRQKAARTPGPESGVVLHAKGARFVKCHCTMDAVGG